jgi:hypothetical protein
MKAFTKIVLDVTMLNAEFYQQPSYFSGCPDQGRLKRLTYDEGKMDLAWTPSEENNGQLDGRVIGLVVSPALIKTSVRHDLSGCALTTLAKARVVLLDN